jgi:hypothetical protein
VGAITCLSGTSGSFLLATIRVVLTAVARAVFMQRNRRGLS